MTSACLLAGCAGPALEGARLAFPGAEPEGDLVADYPWAVCRDAAGYRLPGGPSRVTVVRFDGRPELVERREGYESLVVTNGFEHDGAHIFQAVIESSDGRPWLRQYRVPGNRGPATLEVTDRFAVTRSEEGFRATLGRVVLSCTLSPLPAGNSR